MKCKLAVGTELYWDGEAHVVTAFVGAAVELRSSKGTISRASIASITGSQDFRVITPEGEEDSGEVVTFPDNVPQSARKNAEQILAHLHEARTGYRMGSAALALPSEPRPEFDPETTSLTQRMEAKALELGRKRRWLFEMQRRYIKQGLYGLVDQRATKYGRDRIDERIKDAARAVLDEITELSNITKKQTRRRIERKLEADYPEVKITMPSDATFNRLLNRLAKGRGTFGPAKSRRNAANRPKTSYSHFFANRPGEMVLIDSTPLDAFALDPDRFEWVRIVLTIAFDLFTRSILAWRFTPISTKAVDAALLLYDIIRPKLMQPGWLHSARWPYVGIPENIVIEALGGEKALQQREDDESKQLAGIPFLNMESVLVDRGRIFLSQAFMDACKRLGVNLFIARPLTATDKAHVERVFGSIRTGFVENLPGYTGPDLWSRGAGIENTAFYFLDEIDSLFAEWVATYWQRRHHDGLEFPNVPRLHLSPNDMFEEGIARAGFVYVVPDDRLYYELLPTEWRTIQHYGVEVRGLRYDGDILNDVRNLKSPYGGVHAGKWPLRFDPRDYSRIFFYDHTLDQWHTLRWIGHSDVPRPFDDATLSYAKTLVYARGGNARNHEELRVALNELLNRIDDEVLHGRKERRLAAINAMHAKLAAQDRPRATTLLAPDDEAGELSGGPLINLVESAAPPPVHALTVDEIPIFPTVDEALEDDDDVLVL